MISQFLINNIFIPSTFTIFILKNNNYYVLISNKFINFIWTLSKKFKIEKTTNTFRISYKNLYFYINLRKLLFSSSSININSIRFKGKGYKLARQKTEFTFLFNFSHINILINRKILIKKISKNKILNIFYDLNYLKFINNKIIKIRQANQYTLNGFRLKRQIIYRRKGKTLTT